LLSEARIFDDNFGTDDDEWNPPTVKWDRSVMKVNVPRDTIVDNIRQNIKRPVPQHRPHAEQIAHVAIVGGGWSLDDTLPQLRDLWFRGTKIVALNGAAKWLIERNIKPSIHVVMDAREVNAGFVVDIPGCKYFLASQTHPSVFDACEGKDTYIFHAMPDKSDIERALLDEHYAKRWHATPCAGMVGMVSIMLVRELGFRFQHLFGLDSCLSQDLRHHAYPQSINDREGWGKFLCAGREFRCSAAQAAQAGTFVDIIRQMGEHLQLEVYGDGLLAHILKTGAELKEVHDGEG
jgi:hypothetical protein